MRELGVASLSLPSSHMGSVFDPTKTDSKMMRYYHIGPGELDAMDYMRYFGLLREMILEQEREVAAQNNQAAGGSREITAEDWGRL